ncbi:Aminodeoxychorismate synthase component 1 [Pseudoalteromonas holothuriae]|uniref:aminodeoxychorismate synthase n=1 Tax=Pseudoalteromonas holothuriae TaxID=2963714 RepID=A0A9W4QSJ0_9GAMM|nr:MULTISPECIES: aminodeoxychorismate synthase component I [unclassified Pseudoalteromonas]CAH9051281.1 Aminodeoxychorismate synthase component 1 [Pseudoalteromonas sp. CIP111854]CAH9056772.1 Aminodeoxychorismate synthase component 1 [Pseudoalteromonas sp. CIP111951]
MVNEQINCKKLNISLSAEVVFEHFAHLPYAVLLDSSNAKHMNSRFDLISINPIHRLEAKQGKIYLDDALQNDDCFSIMKQQLNKLCATKAPYELPFSGGWLGYFSYDLGRYIESLPKKSIRDIALPELSIGLYLDALIFDNHKKQWYYVSQPNVERADEYMNYILGAAPDYDEFALTTPWQSNMTQPQYTERFEKIQQYLLSGDCYQINLAQRFSAGYTGAPWLAYKKLRASNKAPFSAFINLERNAVLSVSPERFLLVDKKQVETKPIKGTLPRLDDPKEDALQAQKLASSTKDRAENVMIVDLLRNDLGKVAKPGTVAVPSLFAIESFPAVHHLVSTVTCQLAEGKCAVDQLEAAFPGGSITGAPKIRAMEIIEELEPHRRSVYCGAIGYLSACGRMDTSITIRTLVCSQKQIYCWAGGGIVADSQVNLEYQETYHKVNKILPTLEK